MSQEHINPILANSMVKNLLDTMLEKHSRQVFNFTREELDTIIEYDCLQIMAQFYHRMDAAHKELICEVAERQFGLADVDRLFGAEMQSNYTIYLPYYIPFSCKLVDRMEERNVSAFVFEAIFASTKELAIEKWNKDNSFSTYLALMNAAYFQALAYLMQQQGKYKVCLLSHYSVRSYDELVEGLNATKNKSWRIDVDFAWLDSMIECSRDAFMPSVTMEECNSIINEMDKIRHKYAAQKTEDISGMEYIQERAGITPHKKMTIDGFESFFCMAKNNVDEYIIVYQCESRINEIIEDENRWQKFQRDLYYADIRDGKSNGLVYIIYILDGDCSNIPIQTIEGNRTYGRKYVFTEEETVTFINGIVKTSCDETAAASPAQEWDRILREVHLTGCLTEAYSAKKVNAYLDGERFDADYLADEEYSSSAAGAVPQIKWVKSLDTAGFRDFCFDDAEMEFGQINLFFGANGSGKTSVLEAIEYALTSEVRRVKDFKVKMPSTMYPKIRVYDTEAGIHSFYPSFSKKNAKEIERVWYGVPVGRTKTNLNDNFNRFNSFDSEAAYKFIHSADNDADGFATMFGNLMFGETVVGYEKKWQRFKKAFDETYSELRSKLNDARFWKEIYQKSLANKGSAAHSDEIENLIRLLAVRGRSSLPKDAAARYQKLLNDLLILKKYVDVLAKSVEDNTTFADLESYIADSKEKSATFVTERKEKSDRISELAAENSSLQRKIFDERSVGEKIASQLTDINTTISNWNIVQRVLGATETLSLVTALVEEIEMLDRELFYISKIEQRTSLVRFLKLGSYNRLRPEERAEAEEELADLVSRKRSLERAYDEAKKAFGKKEQQTIELRRIGKTLLTDPKCPLCGQEFDSVHELLEIIDNSVVVDSTVENLIIEIQAITRQIRNLEKILDHEKLIDRAMRELALVEDIVPMVSQCDGDYEALCEYLESKADKEKRKAEIIEQQLTLDRQGFSVKNINACYEFKKSDPTYQRFLKLGVGTFAEYLEQKLKAAKLEQDVQEQRVEGYNRKIQENKATEEVLRGEIRELDVRLEALGIETIREVEQAINNVKLKFTLKGSSEVLAWVSQSRSLFDLLEVEIQRLREEGNIEYERQQLAEYTAIIDRETPRVERCARAVRAFEKMPSLSSFVESGIRNNIQQISKFFRWMHHSGEFIELGIDDDGIYAIRGINNERIRTYQMSTGQRSTIAMAVMFALHMAAPDAPQFLLLDEPLATMDDTQVLNVLDILKSMAEQKTQIFFTTANGVMINLFKECFRGTDFDYKEFHFIKRVNKASTIEVSSVNSVRTIEELTLEDLTLDFHQFAQIREILRKNQEKLVNPSEWEQLPGANGGAAPDPVPEVEVTPENFYGILTDDERRILDILVVDQPENFAEFKKLVPPVPHYKTTVVRINEKAQEFFGETVINDDDELPYIEEDYVVELKTHHDNRPAAERKSAAEQQRLGGELLKAEEERRKAEELRREEELRRLKLEAELKEAEKQRRLEADRHKAAEDERNLAEHRRLQAERDQAEDQRRLEEKRRMTAEEERRRADERRREEEQRRIELEDELRLAEEKHRAELEERKVIEQRRLENERQKAAEAARTEEKRRQAEEKRRAELEDELRKAEQQRLAEEQRRRELEAELKRTEQEKERLEATQKAAEKQRRIDAERRIADEKRREDETRKAEAQRRQAEEQRQLEEERRKAAERSSFIQMNRCQHCGGNFTGLFTKKCSVCGKPKDYK